MSSNGVRFVRIRGRVIPIGQRKPTTAKAAHHRHALKSIAKKAVGIGGFGAGFAISSLGSIALGAGGIIATDAAVTLATGGKLVNAFKRARPSIRSALTLGAVGIAASMIGRAISDKFARRGGLIRRTFD